MNIAKIFGLTLSVFVAGCNSGGGGGGGDVKNDVPVENDVPIEDAPGPLPRSDIRGTQLLYPYISLGPYTNVLKACGGVVEPENACTLGTLPYIGQSGNPVTVSDIMSRVLVTHDWMGQRLESVLSSAPRDMMDLFASVAVISIGSTVRPSSYRADIGGISLDPDYLWLTLDEKANVSIEEDYRSGYGKDLNYWIRQTRRIPGKAPIRWPSLTSYTTRTMYDMTLPLHSLLYHELGHAVDYVSDEVLQLVNDAMTPMTVFETFASYRSSTKLTNTYPLGSEELKSLALVRYRGEQATEVQKSYYPADVGSFLGNDGGMTSYSYLTEREDFAYLLESSMMKKHHNANFITTFVSKPFDIENYSCSELNVGWGQYNRVSDPDVWPRAKWVVEQVYGTSTANTRFFDGLLGQMTELTPGLSWCDTLDIYTPPVSNQAGAKSGYSSSMSFEDLERESTRQYH